MGSLHSNRSGRKPAMSNAVRAFSIIVGLGGAVGAASLPSTGLRESLGTLAVLAVLSAIAGSMSVHNPRSRIEITPGDAFVFVALIVVGSFAAPLVAVAGALGALARRRQPAIRFVFNLGTLALAATAAGWTYIALPRVMISPSASLVALFGAAGAFFLVNTVLVACVIRLHSGAPLFRTWCQSGLWTLTSSLTNVVLAFGLASMAAMVGPVGLTLGLVGCLSIAGSYQAQRQSVVERRTAPTAEARIRPADAVDETVACDKALHEIVVGPSYLPRVDLDTRHVGGEQI